MWLLELGVVFFVFWVTQLGLIIMSVSILDLLVLRGLCSVSSGCRMVDLVLRASKKVNIILIKRLVEDFSYFGKRQEKGG